LQSNDIEREVRAVNESRCILAACRPEEPALELSELRHGVFTDKLIDGMLGSAVDFDGQVSLLSLFEFVSRAIPGYVQTPVFKGDIAGTVVLGRGFEPRRGQPIDKAETKATLAKAQRLVDEYHNLRQRELIDAVHKSREGWRTCSLELESVHNWFNSTLTALPDIARESVWTRLDTQLRDYRRELTELSVGTSTRYGEVTRLIGHGGYGYVWQIDNEDGLSTAFKVFHGNELDQDTKVRRFINGYTNMKKLDHPRIVKVKELSFAPLGFIMDAVPGEDLRKAYVLREEPEQVLRLMVEIAETVQHAHSRGVRHRDIKPENIIIVAASTGGLTPFLTDFDLAYHETNRTLTTNLGVGGVINYAAPEQLHEPNTAAARAESVDVFSLAQLLFFVIVGRDPSADKFADNERRLVAALNSWVEDRAASPIREVYKRCTARNALDRLSLNEFVAKLVSAEAYVLAASGRDTVTEDEMCRRVAHLYAGIGKFEATERRSSMLSLSTQVEIIVRLLDVDKQGKAQVEIELSVTERLPVPSLRSGTDARLALNKRLDKILRRFPNVSRHSGNRGSYQVFVRADKVPMTVAGVAFVSDLVQTSVAGIEAW